jgi:hypothetical protein
MRRRIKFTARRWNPAIGDQMQLIRIARLCHRPAKFALKFALRLRLITQIVRRKFEGGAMRGFHNSSFDPQTLVILEAAFDEAWLTLKSIGNKTVKPDELARCVLRLAMEGERDPVRLHDGALKGLLPATAWREAS